VIFHQVTKPCSRSAKCRLWCGGINTRFSRQARWAGIPRSGSYSRWPHLLQRDGELTLRVLMHVLRIVGLGISIMRNPLLKIPLCWQHLEKIPVHLIASLCHASHVLSLLARGRAWRRDLQLINVEIIELVSLGGWRGWALRGKWCEQWSEQLLSLYEMLCCNVECG